MDIFSINANHLLPWYRPLLTFIFSETGLILLLLIIDWQLGFPV